MPAPVIPIIRLECFFRHRTGIRRRSSHWFTPVIGRTVKLDYLLPPLSRSLPWQLRSYFVTWAIHHHLQFHPVGASAVLRKAFADAALPGRPLPPLRSAPDDAQLAFRVPIPPALSWSAPWAPGASIGAAAPISARIGAPDADVYRRVAPVSQARVLAGGLARRASAIVTPRSLIAYNNRPSQDAMFRLTLRSMIDLRHDWPGDRLSPGASPIHFPSLARLAASPLSPATILLRLPVADAERWNWTLSCRQFFDAKILPIHRLAPLAIAGHRNPLRPGLIVTALLRIPAVADTVRRHWSTLLREFPGVTIFSPIHRLAPLAIAGHRNSLRPGLIPERTRTTPQPAGSTPPVLAIKDLVATAAGYPGKTRATRDIVPGFGGQRLIGLSPAMHDPASRSTIVSRSGLFDYRFRLLRLGSQKISQARSIRRSPTTIIATRRRHISTSVVSVGVGRGMSRADRFISPAFRGPMEVVGWSVLAPVGTRLAEIGTCHPVLLCYGCLSASATQSWLPALSGRERTSGATVVIDALHPLRRQRRPPFWLAPPRSGALSKAAPTLMIRRRGNYRKLAVVNAVMPGGTRRPRSVSAPPQHRRQLLLVTASSTPLIYSAPAAAVAPAPTSPLPFEHQLTTRIEQLERVVAPVVTQAGGGHGGSPSANWPRFIPQISEQVYRRLEKDLRIERERRGRP